MTREELAELVHFVRRSRRSEGHPPYEAIIQLADECDAAIKQRDRALALLREESRWTCLDGVRTDMKVCGHPLCWEHRRRALLAEVDK